MKKRLMAFLLAAVMLVGMLPLTALADETENEEHVHSFELVPEESVTDCKKDGHKAYYKCACGVTARNEDGTGEFWDMPNDLVIKAPGKHTWVKSDDKKDATCTEDGYTQADKCSVCGATRGGKVIPATGHTQGKKLPTIDRTCTEDGRKGGFTCKVCGEEYGYTVTPKLHDDPMWRQEMPEIPANCEEGTVGHAAGVLCKMCAKYLEGGAELPIKHTLVQQGGDVATCTKPGTKAWWDCTVCGKHFKDANGEEEYKNDENAYVEKDPTNHTALHKAGDAKDATCTTKGQTDYWYCDDCKTWFKDEKGTKPFAEGETAETPVNPANHANGLEQIRTAKEATCAVGGALDCWYCADCETFFRDAAGTDAFGPSESADLPKNPNNHTDLKWYSDYTAPTCKLPGQLASFHCEGCNKWYDDEKGTNELSNLAIPADPDAHKLVRKAFAKDATCFEEGSKDWFECEYCGKDFKDINGEIPYNAGESATIPMLNHIDEDGDKYCDNCGMHMTCYHKKIVKKQDAKEVTCEKDGRLDVWYCKTCKTYYTKYDEKTQNYYGILEDKNGDGDHFDDSVIPALGHIDENNDGICDRCEKVLKNVTGVNVVDAKGDGVTTVTAPVVGQVLSANILTNKDPIYSYPVNKDAHYTWSYKGSDVKLGVGPTFTVTSDNVGKILTVTVSVDGYQDEATWTAEAVVTASAIDVDPADEVKIASFEVVDGTDGFTPVETPAVEQILAANVVTDPEGAEVTYVWGYEGSDAVLGKSSRFTVTSDNVGKVITLTVKVGEDVKTWKAAGAVEAPEAPKPTAKVTIKYAFQNEEGKYTVNAELTETIDAVIGEMYEIKEYETFEGFVLNKEKTGGKVMVNEDGRNTIIVYYDIVEAPIETPENVTLTFNANGGAFVNGDEIAVKTVPYGAKTEYTIPYRPSREGYTFAGWYATLDFSEDDEIGDYPLAIADYVFYAKWIENAGVITPAPEKANVTKYLNENLVVVLNCQNQDHEGEQSLVFKHMIHGGTYIKELSETQAEVIFMPKAYLDAANKSWTEHEVVDTDGKMLLTWDPETNTWSGAEAFYNIYVKCVTEDAGEITPAPERANVTKYLNQTLKATIQCVNENCDHSMELNGIPFEGLTRDQFNEEHNTQVVTLHLNAYLAAFNKKFGGDHELVQKARLFKANDNVITLTLTWDPDTNTWSGAEGMPGVIAVNCDAKAPVEVAEYVTVTFVDRGKVVKTVEVEKGHTVNNSAFPSVKRDGYYVKWYTEKDGEGRRFKNTTKVNYDMTVYAHWVSADGTNAKTGDTIAIWVTVMLVAAAGFVAVTVFGAKRKRH